MADEESKEDKKEQQKDVSEIFLKKKILIGGSEINDNIKKSLFQILNKDNVLLNDNQNGKSIKYNIRTKIKTTKNNKATTFEDFKNKLLNAHNNKGNSNTKNIYKLLNKNNKKKMKKSKLLNLSQRFASQQNNKNKKQKLNDKKENENDKNDYNDYNTRMGKVMVDITDYRKKLNDVYKVDQNIVFDDKMLIYDGYNLNMKYENIIDDCINYKLDAFNAEIQNKDNNIAAFEFEIVCNAFSYKRNLKDTLDCVKSRMNDTLNIINLMDENEGTYTKIGNTLFYKIDTTKHEVINYLKDVRNIKINDKIEGLNSGIIDGNEITINIKKFSVNYGINYFYLYHENFRNIFGKNLKLHKILDAINRKKRLEILSAIEETYALNMALGCHNSEIDLSWFIEVKNFVIDDKNDYILNPNEFKDLNNAVINEIASYTSLVKYMAQHQLYKAETKNVNFPLDKTGKLITNLTKLLTINNDNIQMHYINYKISPLQFENSQGLKVLFINDNNIVVDPNNEKIQHWKYFYPRTMNIILDPTIIVENKKIKLFSRTNINSYHELKQLNLNTCSYCGTILCNQKDCLALKVKTPKAKQLFKIDLENQSKKKGNGMGLTDSEVNKKLNNYKPMACFGCNKIRRFKIKHECSKVNINFYSGLNAKNFSLSENYNAATFVLLQLHILSKIMGDDNNLLKNVDYVKNMMITNKYQKKFGQMDINDMIKFRVINSIKVSKDNIDTIRQGGNKIDNTYGIIINDRFIFYDPSNFKEIMNDMFFYKFKEGLEVDINKVVEILDENNNNNIISTEDVQF